MGTPVSVDEVRIGPNGEVEMMSGGEVLTPAASWVEGQRSRTKGGEKRLFRIPGPANFKNLDELEALSKYDQIFVIDTNTVEMNGEPLSVASVAVCSIVQDVGGVGSTLTRKIHMGAYEFRGMRESQERFGWFLFQNSIVKGVSYKPDGRYLLVTDHALSDHPAINERSMPIFDHAMLADGLTIGFATGESGQSFLQKAIRECDRFARDVIKTIRDGLPDDYLHPTPSAPVSHLRLFTYKQPAERNPLENMVPGFILSPDLPYLDQNSGTEAEGQLPWLPPSIREEL